MGDVREDLLPCPFCGERSNFDQWPCEWIDGSGANVVRCAVCHGAAPMKAWNLRALSARAAVPYGDCCDTPAYCSSVRRCTAHDEARAAPQPAGEAKSPADPLPNWCRTCGRLWRDPLGALCPDAIHRRRNSSNPPEPAPSAPADTITSPAPLDEYRIFSLSPEQLVQWLEAKFRRHGEDEDRQAAEMLRRLSAPASVKDCLTTADVEALEAPPCPVWLNDSSKAWALGWEACRKEIVCRLSSAQQAGDGKGGNNA